MKTVARACTIVAGAGAGLLMASCCTVSRVVSASMVPTIPPGSHLIVRRIHSTDPLVQTRRGDVVIVRGPHSVGGLLVKRLIAIPGDRVAIREGIVFINGVVSTEPYAHYRSSTQRIADRWPVGSNETLLQANAVFVLGDNRSESSDSRAWGPTPASDIVGAVLFVLP